MNTLYIISHRGKYSFAARKKIISCNFRAPARMLLFNITNKHKITHKHTLTYTQTLAHLHTQTHTHTIFATAYTLVLTIKICKIVTSILAAAAVF